VKKPIRLVFFLSFCFFHLTAQQSAQQELARALDLIQQGRSNTAVLVLASVLKSTQFSSADRGRAWALLGYAYKEEGKFTASEKSFSRAFELLRMDGIPTRDYAAALSYYAGLLIAKGDLSPAAEALRQAIELYRQTGSHAELSAAYTRMAGLDISLKKYKEARAGLALARAEANSLGDSVPSTDLDATTGWLDTSTGKVREAVADYEKALDDCRVQYGEEHMLTGWSYLLLSKAQESDHNLTAASQNMNTGLQILKATVGTNNIRYLAGQLAYSGLLEKLGSHEQAAALRSAAYAALANIPGRECSDCSVSVWSLLHR
jgi:tetratricopeptide (TPR) repeat protein